MPFQVIVMRKNNRRGYKHGTPVTRRAGPIKLQWFEHAQRLQFVSIRRDPVTGKEIPSLCFTAEERDLRERPEAIALIEMLIEKARQVQ